MMQLKFVQNRCSYTKQLPITHGPPNASLSIRLNSSLTYLGQHDDL